MKWQIKGYPYLRGFLVAVGMLASVAGAASAKETVKIAFIGPLTGPVSNMGIGARNSAELAVQLANANPASKYHYKLESFDTQCKPDVGVQVATRIASSQNYVAAVGPYCSNVAMATVGIFHRFQMPLVVWGAAQAGVTYAHNYDDIDRVNASLDSQTVLAAKFMTGLGYKKWVIIHDTLDLGNALNRNFERSLKAAGGKLLGSFGVDGNQQDFTAILTKIKQLQPQAIYIGTLTPLAIRIRRQMDKLGVDVQVVGNSGMMSDSYLKVLGHLSNGTVLFFDSPPIADLPEGPKFLKDYASHGFTEPPESRGPFAFAATNLVIHGVQSVGPHREKLIGFLRHTQGFDSLIGKVDFDAHGQNVNPLWQVYVADNGSWVPWHRSGYATGKEHLLK